MTIGEIKRAADGINWRLKVQRQDTANFDYTLACLIGRVVGNIMSTSKQPMPPVEEVYPDIFERDEEAIQEQRMQLSTARFIQFANNFNANFKKSEDINNG